jgi:hypothetical protein
VVEGSTRHDVGLFDLTLTCNMLEVDAVDDTCSYSYMTCGDVVTGAYILVYKPPP